MSARTYLSIGDVLSLLREEFPDVTISKIRFLESQGLVDPERSPSGYRKFYEPDVERLRWVLRQQREHFLPLKVIRDRLAAAGTGVPAEEGYDPIADTASLERAVDARHNGDAEWRERAGDPADAGTDPSELDPQDQGLHVAGPGGVGRGGGNEGPDPRQAGHREDANGVAPVLRPAAGTARHWAGTFEQDEETDAPVVAIRAGQGEAVRGAVEEVRSATAAPGGPPPGRDEEDPVAESVTRHPPEAAGAPARPRGTAVAGAAPPAAVASGPADSAMLHASVSGASMTLEELCAATGLSPVQVSSLESYGLLAPMAVAGAVYYDEEVLTVAKLVVEFARYGIEPRHLRLYRNAADREIGLVEQVITPLLRQRNPEARQRAVTAAGDLARLGQGLRAALVRAQLRRQLGG